MFGRLENIKNKIAQMAARYNADHDVGVDFNFIDMELLDIIDRLLAEVVELRKDVSILEQSKND